MTANTTSNALGPQAASPALSSFFAVPMFAAFALSPVFHGSQQTVKFPVFAFAVFSAVCFVLSSSGRLFLHRTVVLWTIFFVAVGLFWVELGVLNQTPGAIATTTIYVMWPMVFLLFINMMNNVEQFRRLSIVFFVACWLAVIADVGYILEILGYIPGTLFQIIASRNTISLSPEGPQYSSSRVGVMLFAIPVLVSLILHHWEGHRGKRLVFVSWLLLLPMLLLTFIAQRRAIYVVIFLAPIIALVLSSWMPRPTNSRSRVPQMMIPVILACAGLAFLAYRGLIIDWSARVADLMQGFDFSGRAGTGDFETNARALQLRAMIAAWMDNPILGAGHGAALSVVRDNEMPWAYELTYGALLFQTGTLGFLAYSSGIAWTLYQLILILRDPDSPVRLYAFGMISGMIGLIIGSATNPYLVTFDSLWAVFMPIGLINMELLRRERQALSGHGPVSGGLRA